jgi:hypothetical protein
MQGMSLAPQLSTSDAAPRARWRWFSAVAVRWLLTALFPLIAWFVQAVVRRETTSIYRIEFSSPTELIVLRTRALHSAIDDETYGNVAEVINVHSGKVVRSFEAPPNQHIAFSSDGVWIVHGTPEGFVRVLYTTEFVLHREWFIGKETSFRCLSADILHTGYGDAQRLWRMKSGEMLPALPGGHLVAAQPRPNGSLRIVMHNRDAPEYLYEVFELDDGQWKLRRSFPSSGRTGHFHPSELKSVREWRINDVTSGNSVALSPAPTEDGWAHFSPGGQAVLAVLWRTGEVAAWDANTGRQLCQISYPRSVFDEDRRAAISKDLSTLATFTTWGSIQIWDVPTGQLLRVIPDHRLTDALTWAACILWCGAWLAAGRMLVRPSALLDIAVVTAISLAICVGRVWELEGLNGRYSLCGWAFYWRALGFGFVAGTGSLLGTWSVFGSGRRLSRSLLAIVGLLIACHLLDALDVWPTAVGMGAVCTAPFVLTMLVAAHWILYRRGHRLAGANAVTNTANERRQWTLQDLFWLLTALGLFLALSRQVRWWKLYSGSTEDVIFLVIGGIVGLNLWIAVWCAWRRWPAILRCLAVLLAPILTVIGENILFWPPNSLAMSALAFACLGVASAHAFLCHSLLRRDGYRVSKFPPADAT